MTQTPSTPQPNATTGDDEPLEHLYKMSPTAGVATADYAAINTASIVTIILGAASVLVLLNVHLLLIPIAGFICGIVAIRQIRNSNGTQVGRGLAWGGLILSLLLGGGVMIAQSSELLHRRADQQEIAALMEQIGQQIHDEQYDAIYAQASQRLRDRVSQDAFDRQISAFNIVPQAGKLQWFRWNQEPMYFEINPDSGFEQASAMAMEKLQNLSESGRQLMVFVKEGGKWSLYDLNGVFLQQAPRKNQQGGKS